MLLQRADTAMYDAKARGKSTISHHDGSVPASCTI
jgi:PleD family two-component response regulator